MYEQTYRVLSSDADPMRRLRLSRLFTLLQEASIAHTIELGMGREKTLDRGLLWIVTLQQASIRRLPVYDEKYRLLSWPGKTMHLFFPRHYRLENADGELLVEANALWALMDAGTRRIVFPEEHGIQISEEKTGWETPLPSPPQSPKEPDADEFAVPYSYADLNGHMNNTRYFDLAEDRMPEELRCRRVRSIRAEYAHEIRAGERITLLSETQTDQFLLLGERDGQKLFKLSLTYNK
ncbi:MAG: hypothetical protein IJG45_03085 [Oscillospiraceae bacterium]|nr:hypothetical protein [Oscillospiraceae bacterium]